MAIIGTELLIDDVEEAISEMLRSTHVVTPADNHNIWAGFGFDPKVTGSDIVAAARTYGLTVTALCDYKFVPVHDPEKYDVCDFCMEIAQQRMMENNE